LSLEELHKFLDRMDGAPASIHHRPGFADGMVEAADQILAKKPDSDLRRFALITKMSALHESAFDGNDESDKRLTEVSKSLLKDPDPAVVKEAKFYELERAVMAGDDVKLADIPKLLDQVHEALGDQILAARHLRIASATVHLINRLEDDDQATKRYHELGEQLATADDSELSAYGRRIAKGARPPSMIGKPLEIAGKSLDGADIDIQKFKGKIVLVDFWATWCPPCRAKLPGLMKLYEQRHPQGLEVIGVSMDQDLDALAKFVEEQKVPWNNIVGEKAGEEMQFPLATKYDISGIPTLFLVGRDGKVIAHDPTDAELEQKLDELLKEKGK
jgi:thiol-disulfide isomerase/thioredoxin